MSAQFIIGRAGAGKTHYCRARTLAACGAEPLGAPIIWLVPRQATFQTQRDLCCGGGQDGFFRVRVLSFEQLCKQVLEETGGSAAPQVTRMGRRILLGRFLRRRQSELRFFKSAASHAGLAGEFDLALDELQRGGADLPTLHTRMAHTTALDSLADKIADLQLIYGDYAAFLGRQRLDPDRRLLLAMQSFDQSALLKNATVYVDGFLHFTQRERRLICTLGRVCPSLHVTLMMDAASPILANPHHIPDELGLFHSLETEYRHLQLAFAQERIKIEPPLKLSQTRRFQAAGLNRLERWSGAATRTATEPVETAEGVELIEAPDKRAEVEYAARRILELVAAGHRYRDITLLVRDLNQYQDLIDGAFAEHRIAYFTDQRRSAAHHPLMQFVRAAFSTAVLPWQAEAMSQLFKTGLCGLTAPEADELENDLIERDIRGQGWTQEIGDALSSADLLRGRVVELVRPFIEAMSAGSLTVEQICEQLFALLDRCGVRQTISRWIADARASASHQQALEHQQVWAELLDLFGQFHDLLGEEPLLPADFQATLDASLETFDLAIAPPTVDQLLVGQVDRTRPPAVKVAIVLGLSNGQFPRRPEAQPIFSDADRYALAGAANLEPDTRRQALDEEFLGYFAFTRASQRLIAMRPAADDSGRKAVPGSLWRKLESRLGVSVQKLAAGGDAYDPVAVSTPRQLVGGLMRWARASDVKGDPHPSPLPEYMERGREDEARNSELWANLYQWLATRDAPADDVERVRRLAWPALKYANDAHLSKTAADEMFPSPLRASARQLETFRACPFQHFARYGLHLSPRARALGDSQEVSRACREVLSGLVRRLLMFGTNWCDFPPKRLENLLHQFALAVASERAGASAVSARDAHLAERIENAVGQIVAAQKAASQRSLFRPAEAAVRFGDHGALPPLEIKTRSGKSVLLSGEIDRVDLSADGGATIVYDYRMKAPALSLAEIYHGLRLSQPVNLLAWLQTREKTHTRPAAALTVPIRREAIDADPRKALEPSDERFALQSKPRGIISEQFAPDMDSGIQPSSHSDALALYVNKEAEFRMRSRTDIAAPNEFAAMLDHVGRMLGRLADEILEGRIAVAPYKMGTQTPCSHCNFLDVCRFETTDRHELLRTMSREKALELMGSTKPG